MKFKADFLILATTLTLSSSWSFNLLEIFDKPNTSSSVSKSSNQEKSMDQLISEGLGSNKKKDYRKGLELLQTAVQNNQEQSKAHYFLGKQYMEMSSLPEFKSNGEQYQKQAKESFQKALSVGSSSSEASDQEWSKAAKKMLDQLDGNIATITQAELNALATLALLEAGSKCTATDPVQVVFNRLNDPSQPKTLNGVMFARGQFQPYSDPKRGLQAQPWMVDTETKAASFVVNHRAGYTHTSALAEIRRIKAEMGDPQKMKNSRDFVGGRTFFKGVSQYPNRVVSEDPLRQQGCNFYHIGRGQSYSSLSGLEKHGPIRVVAK